LPVTVQSDGCAVTVLPPRGKTAIVYGLQGWEVNSVLAKQYLEELSVCDSLVVETQMILMQADRRNDAQEKRIAQRIADIEDCSGKLEESARQVKREARRARINSLLTGVSVPVALGLGIGIGVYIAK
jgi:hypothetical protein